MENLFPIFPQSIAGIIAILAVIRATMLLNFGAIVHIRCFMGTILLCPLPHTPGAVQAAVLVTIRAERY